MRAERKRWLWLALVLIGVFFLGRLFRSNSNPDRVAISFIGYTNAPNDRFKHVSATSTQLFTNTSVWMKAEGHSAANFCFPLDHWAD
jgi:hypothetical protein